MTGTDTPAPVRLRLYSRDGCHLCEQMRRDVDRMLGETPRTWEVISVDSDAELRVRFGDSIPVLFVNGRLFAKTRLSRLATRFRLARAAASPADD